ncbi:hypothetical protein llap_19395 [Limosa lapponica baueri]|uniref:Core shell protein Gag P30 domain-containing protein n=1 Tax=Limosa lapponica baueri TaxID=1758121 RepID=A0A2I0T969_LIMLA|nr:hypothetical protein llap_19395 [Limosa lapponica baueri]
MPPPLLLDPLSPHQSPFTETESGGSGEEEGEAATAFTPVTTRTRSKTQRVPQLLVPLREVMGSSGAARVKIPFSTTDLNDWKEVARGYRDDPSKVAKRFELIVRNQDPDWRDVDLILGEMTETEKQLVLKTARTHVQAQITGRVLQGSVDKHVPLTDPNWDPNDGQDYAMLRRYRD